MGSPVQDAWNPFEEISQGVPVGSTLTNGKPTNSYSDDLQAALQNNGSPEEALQWLKDNNPELYYQLILERDNNRLEWERYADYQRNYYSLMAESLEKAGMNPWLVLQNFSSIGTGSIGHMSQGTGSSTLKAQRESNEASLAGKGLGAFGAIIGAIIGALIMATL